MISGKVISLEKEVKATEDRLREATESEAASREATIIGAKQQAVEDFERSEEYKSLHNYNTSYDDRYDKDVEEIFFNIWRKCREVDSKFPGKEHQALMADWEE